MGLYFTDVQGFPIIVSTQFISDYSFDGVIWYTLGNGVRLANNGKHWSLVINGQEKSDFFEPFQYRQITFAITFMVESSLYYHVPANLARLAHYDAVVRRGESISLL